MSKPTPEEQAEQARQLAIEKAQTEIGKIEGQRNRDIAAAEEKARQALITGKDAPAQDPAKGEKDPVYIAWTKKNDPDAYERLKRYLPEGEQ